MPEPSQEARDLAQQLHSPRPDLIDAALSAAYERGRHAGREEALAPFRAARVRALVRARFHRMRDDWPRTR